LRIEHLDEGVGRIIKGVNTTPDVGVDQTRIEAAKFGNKVDKDGRPPTLSSAVKGKSTNVLFNLGLTEGIKLRLERDKDIDVLHIMDTKDKQRIEVRGKKGYESGNYDAQDKLHQVLDRVGKAANISELMNGEVVSINPNHPQGTRAIRTARDVLQTEEKRFTAMEQAIIEGGHSLDDIKPQPKKLGRIFTALENVTEALDNPYPFNLQGPDSSHNFAATAQTPNGVLRMDFEAVDYDDFGIDFAVGKSMGKTEAGDEFRVFATVVAMMKQWISVVGIQHVESFDFGANKGEHASDGRARLYARFAKKLADQLGWKLEQSTTANRDTEFFKLTNPDPVPRDDSHWDNLEDNPDLQDHSELEENFADGKKKITERKSADLYHSTHDDESFVGILKSGAIKPNFDHEHTTEKDPRPYISLSRDKRFDMFGSLPITLVIDQGKLSSSHKILPYDSFASDDDFEKRSSGNSEAEERVYKPIPISYIKYVILRNANWIDSEAVLAAAKAANIPVIDLNGQPIKENFADGKVKGKSRPGRVKKSGASCNGSVTALRKRAKNASGEKAKMYHWCANMKSGRKKK